MKKVILFTMVLMQLLASGLGQAADLPFRDDPKSIGQAAQRVFLLRVYDVEKQRFIGEGSGFLAFDNRTLITTYKVVENGHLVKAVRNDGWDFVMDSVLIADKGLDLAILRFNQELDMEPLPLNAQGDWQAGHPVVAIGGTQGKANNISKAKITDLLLAGNRKQIKFTQPAASFLGGSALFDNQGQVIGVIAGTAAGKTQKAGTAIDIREVLALYAQSEPVNRHLLRDMHRYQLGEAQKKPAGTPQKNAGTITGLAAKQIRKDSVLLTWKGQPEEGGSLYLSYKNEGSGFSRFVETRLTSLVFEDLVPGQTYVFSIATSREGLDESQNTVRLRMAPAKPVTIRGCKLVYMGLLEGDPDRDVNPPLFPGLTTITKGSLESAQASQRLGLVYRISLKKARDESVVSCLCVLISPTGAVYTNAYFVQFSEHESEQIRKIDLDVLLDLARSTQVEMPLGTWKVQVYFNGELLGQTSFEAVPGPAADLTTSSEPVQLPLVMADDAYVNDGQVSLVPMLTNASEKDEVSGFTLMYYAEGKDGAPLSYQGMGGPMLSFTYNLAVSPGQSIVPFAVPLKGFGSKLFYVYVAISKVQLADGSVLTVPVEQLEFKSWTIK